MYAGKGLKQMFIIILKGLLSELFLVLIQKWRNLKWESGKIFKFYNQIKENSFFGASRCWELSLLLKPLSQGISFQEGFQENKLKQFP